VAPAPLVSLSAHPPLNIPLLHCASSYFFESILQFTHLWRGLVGILHHFQNDAVMELQRFFFRSRKQIKNASGGLEEQAEAVVKFAVAALAKWRNMRMNMMTPQLKKFQGV
jgi:hypothetical protein